MAPQNTLPGRADGERRAGFLSPEPRGLQQPLEVAPAAVISALTRPWGPRHRQQPPKHEGTALMLSVTPLIAPTQNYTVLKLQLLQWALHVSQATGSSTRKK